MQRPLRLVAVAATLLLAGQTAAAAPSRTATPPRTAIFHLVEVSEAGNYVDNPPRQGVNAPPLIGDQFTFESELETLPGAHAGRLEATCTVANGGTSAQAPCLGVLLLAGGQIEVQTAARLSGSAPLHIAVVGGTGVYVGVTGTMLSVPHGDTTYDTLYLRWR